MANVDRPPYERFRAWQACHALALAVYEATATWPPAERFALTAQLRRSVWSAAANIAEGSARRGPREFARFLDISNGSLAEVGYGLRLARDLGYLKRGDADALEALRTSAARLTFALSRRVRRTGGHSAACADPVAAVESTRSPFRAGRPPADGR